MKFVVTILMAGSIGMAPVPAFAQAQQQPAPAQQAPSAGDPNEVVCEKQTVTGSRIAARRVCRTRAEWAQQQQADRMEVEKVQVQRGSCEGC